MLDINRHFEIKPLDIPSIEYNIYRIHTAVCIIIVKNLKQKQWISQATSLIVMRG